MQPCRLALPQSPWLQNPDECDGNHMRIMGFSYTAHWLKPTWTEATEHSSAYLDIEVSSRLAKHCLQPGTVTVASHI